MRAWRPFHRRKTPVGKPAGLVAFESIVEGREFVGERSLGNHAARKLTGERVPGEKALCGVSQRFAGTVDSAAIGRDQPIALRQSWRPQLRRTRLRWRRDQR